MSSTLSLTVSKRTESDLEKVMKRPISPFYYGLRVYTNHSIEGHTVVDLIKSIAVL